MHILIGFFVTVWSVITIAAFAVTAALAIWSFSSSRIDTRGGWLFSFFAALILSLYFLLQNVRF